MKKPVKPVVTNKYARLMTTRKNSGTPDVRKFDVGSVNAAITKAMKTLPKGKTVAAIAYVDRKGANIALVGRIPKVPGEASWTVLGTREWSGNWDVSAAVRWSI